MYVQHDLLLRDPLAILSILLFLLSLSKEKCDKETRTFSLYQQ